MKALKFSRKQLGIPYAVFIGLFVVLPLLLIVLYAFTVERGEPTTNDVTKFSFSFENFVYFFGSSANIRAIYVSFGLAIVTTAICLLVAYPVAYILARSKMKWRNVILMLFILPMWINFVLRTAAMKELLFKIGMYRSSKLSMVNTVIGMVYDYLPFTILPLYTVLIKLDKSILEASADLGRDGRADFLQSRNPPFRPGNRFGDNNGSSPHDDELRRIRYPRQRKRNHYRQTHRRPVLDYVRLARRFGNSDDLARAYLYNYVRNE